MWKTILSKKVYKGTVKNKAKDGSAFYLSTTIIPMLNRDNRIEEFIAIRHDITKIAILNEKLLAAQSQLNELNLSLLEQIDKKTKKLTDLNNHLKEEIQLEVEKSRKKSEILFRQNRLSSMGEMLANIAHQWRQPLNELSINLFKLKHAKDKNDFDVVYEYSKNIIKSMSCTIDDFRNFFSTNVLSENFSLSNAVKKAEMLCHEALASSNVQVNFDLENDSEIVGKENQIIQVILNLIVNAKDAYNEQKNRKKSECELSIVKISLKKSAKFAIVEIKDQAGGIKNDILENIFLPYFTTKHQNIGTGLGLYMCRKILDKMGGKITAQNINGGTMFILKIPYKENK